MGERDNKLSCVPFQFLNQETGFYGNWCERYAIGGHPNLTLFNLLVGKNSVADARTCEVGKTLAELNIGF
jgi:hypothetical protein